jgi:Tfp pilus assembly protein PilF
MNRKNFIGLMLVALLVGLWGSVWAEEKSAEEWLRQGNELSKAGNYDEAITAYNQAIAIDPNRVNAYYNRAQVYWLKGQYELAIEDYTRELALNPDNAKAYNNRGVAFDKQGRHWLHWKSEGTGRPGRL